MSLTIKKFVVLDTSNGQMATTGRSTSTQISNILSQATLRDGVTEHVAVPGTPTTISSGSLFGNAHMGSSYVQLIRDLSQNVSIDSVFVPELLRLTFISGTCLFRNTILYGFAPSSSTSLTSITFTVLFANGNAQTVGDYFDIQLPDSTSYPNIYLVLVILPNAWPLATVVDLTNKLYSFSGSESRYTTNPSQNSPDSGTAHTIQIQGRSSYNGFQTRVVVAFEDRRMYKSDKDYNDVMISICSRYMDDLQTNDTNIS